MQGNMNEKAPSPPSTSQPADSARSSPRKRTNEEVYFSSQMAHSETSQRPNTAPEQNMQRQMVSPPSFKPNASSAVRSHQDPSSASARSTLKPECLNASTNTTAEDTRAFQDAMKGFQDQLDKEYREF